MKTQMLDVELQEADRKAYHDQGFWIGPELFDDTAVEELRDAVYRTIRGERDFDSMHWGQPPKFDPQSPKLAHVVNGWWVNAKIRELIQSKEIGYLASQLMETGEVRLVHDQVLYKPGVGSELEEVLDGNVGWHQDAAHWTMFNSTTFCTAWIALQDTDLANGSMRFVEGSHKWGLIKAAAGFANKDLHASGGKVFSRGPAVGRNSLRTQSRSSQFPYGIDLSRFGSQSDGCAASLNCAQHDARRDDL